MKKNGFTLIELLAVIVILAIIALIATPIVLNIIEDTKNSATLRSADFYLDAVELSIAEAILDGGSIDGTYTVATNGNICKTEDNCITVEVSGDTPDNGSTITIANGQISSMSLNYDNKTVIKDNNELVFADSESNDIPTPVSFQADDWSTIIANVKAGNTDAYIVGAEKTITLTSVDDDSGNADGIITGEYTVRLANKSTLEECSDEGFSQTACGFVIEFVDVITKRIMNSGEYTEDGYTGTHEGGWPSSELYDYVNGTIYNSLPTDVREGIIDTTVVSVYDDTKYTSEDMLYLLSIKEIYGVTYEEDTIDETRQLDYYYNEEVTLEENVKKAIKKYNDEDAFWWLRSAYYSAPDYYYYVVIYNGLYDFGMDVDTNGIAPAFRLG